MGGVKGMSATDRVTEYIVTNATESKEVLLVLIGTAKNPMCISSLTFIFGCWLRADILPAVMKADLTQACEKRRYGKSDHKTSALAHVLVEMTQVLERLSMGARSVSVEEDVCDALHGVQMKPGDKPSKASMEAAQAWISVK